MSGWALQKKPEGHIYKKVVWFFTVCPMMVKGASNTKVEILGAAKRISLQNVCLFDWKRKAGE